MFKTGKNLIRHDTEDLIEFARNVAAIREKLSRARGLKRIAKNGENSGKNDPLGALGEIYMHYVALPGRYEFVIEGTYKVDRDFGPCELETVDSYDDFHRLILREDDIKAGVPRDTPYILVVVTEEDGNWYGELRGWYYIGEGLARTDKSPLPSKKGDTGVAWVIPNEVLRPMSELWEILNQEVP